MRMLLSIAVFSAQAEVFLPDYLKIRRSDGFLRASGGVSAVRIVTTGVPLFSPRKRRCFYVVSRNGSGSSVFSAQAEVFLRLPLTLRLCLRFLRASGGVSI